MPFDNTFFDPNYGRAFEEYIAGLRYDEASNSYVEDAEKSSSSTDVETIENHE